MGLGRFWWAAIAVAACNATSVGEPAPPDDRPAQPDDPQNPPPTERTCEPGDRDPGRVTIHRLNRSEYNNTIRDLLGDDSRPADDFPADDFGYGYDNIGDVLSISPLLFEKYELTGQTLIERAIGGSVLEPLTQVFEAEGLISNVGAASGDAWNLWANGELTANIIAPVDGEYELSVRAWGQQAGAEPARMEILLDSMSLMIFDVPEVYEAPGIFRHRTQISAGTHSFRVAFVNDYYEPPADRNLMVDWLQIEGPLDDPPPANPEAYARIMLCDPEVEGRRECAGEIITAFATRAWRRPPSEEEVERLLQLTDLVFGEGDGFGIQIRVALEAILLSPHFLFRVELDPAPTDGTPHRLTAFELASRLSYFFWSSMPDAELFSLAERGELSDPDVLAAQVARMMQDPKADALIENFVGQWLATRALEDVNPDSVSYPQWDEELKLAMKEETHAFVRELFTSDRSALEIVSADFTYLNDRLARHYGLPPVGSDEMVRVELESDRRGGILKHGSVLTVTSHPRRTSPVKRGKFVLEHLLCQSPPAPPPNVEAFPEVVDPDASLRDRFEQHRADPTCQPCHALMDPIGFALEHYDGIGAWRNEDEGFAINATGELVDGRSFDGAAELASVIQGHERLPECIARNLMTYGLGRGLVPKDDCYVEDVVSEFAANGYTLKNLLVSMTQSGAFVLRRGEPE